MLFLHPVIPERGHLEGPLATQLRYGGSVPNGALRSAHNCFPDYEGVWRRRARDRAYPTHSPPQAQQGKELGRVGEAPTSEHDAAKHCVVPVQGGAVPAVVAELVLTLADPFSGTLAHRAHDVRVALAQLPLPAHQTRDIVTDHAGPQGPDVPARWTWPCQSIPALFLHEEGTCRGKVWHLDLGLIPSPSPTHIA